MSVLTRDIDAYQRALKVFQQKAKGHNRQVEAYNNTLVRDSDGNPLLIDGQGNVFRADSDGRLTQGQLPGGSVADYGLSSLPDTSAFRLLRQNPTSQARETRDDVRYIPGFNEDGVAREGYYYTVGPEQGDGGGAIERLSGEWRVDERIPGRQMGPDQVEADRFRVSRDASVYADRPGEFTEKFDRRAPDPTRAAIQRAASPSMAEAEIGLIGQVMRGKGVR